MNKYLNILNDIKTKSINIIDKITESVKGKNNTKIKLYNPFFNPIFHKEEKLENNLINNEVKKNIKQYYEIYKLNGINNSFYFTYQDESKKLEILKYNFTDKSIKKISTINVKSQIMKMKYYFDELNKKEYLFILLGWRELCINIYQIENENNYNQIYSYGLIYGEDPDLQSMRGLSICDFDILYNEYLNINNFIVSYYYYIMGHRKATKKIKFLKFENNTCILYNKYLFSDDTIDDYDKIKIIYNDKSSKQYYLLVNYKDDIYHIKVTNGELEEKIQFDEEKSNKLHGCIVYTSNGNDYLYLYDNLNILYVYDIKNKQRITKFKISDNINPMLNWNNKYIIFGLKNNICLFDTQINKIITKYYIEYNLCKNNSSIKKLWIKNINFYSLCLESDDKILRLFY